MAISKLKALVTFDRESLAEGAYEEGDKEKAARLYEAAGNFDEAGRIYVELKDVKKASSCMLRAKLDSDTAKAYANAKPEQAGGLLAATGCYEEALTLFELGGAYKRAAGAALKLRLWGRAASNYERAREWSNAAIYYEREQRIPDLIRVLRKDSDRLAKERYESADPALAKELKQVDLRRAELLSEAGNHQEAARILRNWQPETPAEAKIFEKAAGPRQSVEAYLRMEKPDEALRVLLDSRNPDQKLLAETYGACGRWQEAARIFESEGLHRQAAQAYERMGGWAIAARKWEAMRDFNRASECFKRAGDKVAAGRCLAAAGKVIEAAEMFDRAGEHAMAAAKYLESRRPFEAANQFLRANLKTEAKQALTQVPTSDPGYSQAAVLLAPLLLKDGKPTDVLQRLNKVNETERTTGPNAHEFLYWEARALEDLDRGADAQVRYRRLLHRRSEHRDASSRLALLDERFGSPLTVAVADGGARHANNGASVPPQVAQAPPAAGAQQAASGVDPNAPTVVMSRPDEAPPIDLRDGIPVGFKLANRYEIRSLLGKGGMGQVYRAHDLELKDDVAIKTLLQQGPESVEEERLLREVQICRRITHQNIVRVYDLGRFPGGLFVTMELIEGLPLDSLLKIKGSLPVERVNEILSEISSGLAEAHAADVVHRDLKPGNIMIMQGKVKILDFGIARKQDQDTKLTQTGTAIGSPLYMSPEQLQGEPVDHRSDLYSLGVLAYTLLVGHEPFRGENIMAIALAHLKQPAPDPREERPELPETWSNFVLKLMAKTPDARYADASEVLEALQQLAA